MIKTINALRGIFAIVIVLFHAKIQLMNEVGSLAVSFFLVASGFLLTMHHHDKDLTPPKKWCSFMWKRACRIYPIHWLALALYLLLYIGVMHQPLMLNELIAEVALVHCWIPNKDFFFAYNGLSWFLGVLLFHYACFPLINKYYSHLRLRWQVAVMLILIAACAWMLEVIPNHLVSYTYICPLVRMGDFLIGVTAANAYRATSHSTSNYIISKATFIEVVTVITTIALIVFNRITKLPPLWGNYLLWWVPAAFILYILAILDHKEGLIGRILTIRPFQFLGNISLEIYLFQNVVYYFLVCYIVPIYKHIGFVPFHKYVWTQLLLLILLSWGINSLRKQINRRTHQSGITK